jgi:outer membrane protein TolC
MGARIVLALCAAVNPLQRHARAQEMVLPPLPASASPSTAASSGAAGVYYLTLDEAKRQALAHNSDLAVGRFNLQEKLFATSAAKRDYLPKIVANVAYLHFSDNLGKVVTVQTGRFGILPPGTTERAANVVNQDTSVTALSLVQPITKLTVVNAAVRIATADALIAQAQLDKGTRDLLSGVAAAFYGLSGAQRIEAALVLQANYLRQLVAANSTPDLRVGQIEAEQALVEVRAQISDITEQINNLIGFPAGSVLVLIDPLPAEAPVLSADEAADRAVSNNPQILEAMAGIQKARCALTIAMADYLPDIGVFGSYFNQTAANYIQPNFGAIGVVGSYTIFEWGKKRQVKYQRTTTIALAEANVRATIEKVAQHARQAYHSYEKARDSLRLANEMVQARNDAANGLQDPAALLAAKAAASKAELESMQAETAYRVAIAQLTAAIGGW